MMNYDLKKTLNENKVSIGLINEYEMIDEVNVAKIGGEPIEMLAKAIEDGLKAGIRDVEIIGKDGKVTKAASAFDVITAAKEGKLTAGGMGKVYEGLLKSSKTPANVVDAIIASNEFAPAFNKRWQNYLSKPDVLTTKLRGEGYSDATIQKMLNKSKGGTITKLGGDATKAGASAGEDIAKAAREGNLTINGNIQIIGDNVVYTTGNGNKITSAIAQDGSKAIANDAEVLKGGTIIKDGKKTPIKPDPIDGETIIGNGKKRKRPVPVPPEVTKKLSNKWKWALGLLGGGAAVWWAIYQSRKERVPELNDCVMGLVDAGIGKYVAGAGGALTVYVEKTGNEEWDKSGGLYFYMGNPARVISKDGKLRGNWTCKNGVATPQIGAADAAAQPINEQLSGGLNADVDRMIDLLDFPVTKQDLKDAVVLLKKYYGTGQAKTFLDRYQKSGLGGGDLLKTLNFIYTSSPESVENKGTLIRMYQEMRDSKDVKKGGKLTDYVNITWDGGDDGGGGDDDKPVPEPKPEQIQYHDCSSKDLEKGDTLEIGCIHPAIKKLQECKLSKGADLGPSGADGKFGPKLSGLLGGKTVIDKSLYDAQMATCAAADTPKPADATPADTTTTPAPTPDETTRVADMVKTTDSVNKPEPEQTQEIIDLVKKGHELYASLYENYKNGRIIPFIKGGKNRIIYKGDLMSQSDLDALNAYIRTLGFAFEKQKDKEYDEDDGKEIKYKWTKRAANPPAQATPDTVGAGEEPEAAQPQNLSENLIKNIVSKHLRSRL